MNECAVRNQWSQDVIGNIADSKSTIKINIYICAAILFLHSTHLLGLNSGYSNIKITRFDINRAVIKHANLQY